jgi:GLPGLI family protein
MKKLSKLRLNVLNEQGLEEKQMNALRGGNYCKCSFFSNHFLQSFMRYILLVVLCLSLELDAQLYFLPSTDVQQYSGDIDFGNIKIWYALNPVENNRDSCEDLHVLEIGQDFSKYYSYNVFRIDSLRINHRKRYANANSFPHFVDDRYPFHKYFWSEYYKDFTKNILTEYACMPRRVPNCWYSEKISEQNWEIHDDTLTVAGYFCQKASCSFRGRNYTAWFTTDVPINNGPWKFGGLPGLILKVYDTDNYYVFECIGIENHSDKFPIRTYNYSEYHKVKREYLLKSWKGIFDDYIKFTGGTAWLRDASKIPPPKELYHPLELE